MSTHDKIEQIKKPSTGASIKRKINIGEKYEGLELEVWQSSGTLEDTDRETLKQELEEIVEDLTEIVEKEVREQKEEDLNLEQIEDAVDQTNRELSAGDVEAAGKKLRNILRELQSR